jgi:hypothetical protein
VWHETTAEKPEGEPTVTVPNQQQQVEEFPDVMAELDRKIEQGFTRPGLPAAARRDVERHLVAQRVGGFELDREWIPEVMARRWPVLAELRAEHHAYIDQVVAANRERSELERTYAQADEDHARALREAMTRRQPPPEPPEPSPEARDRELAPFAEKAKAATMALGGFVVQAIEVVRAHEDELLADLRGDLPALQERVAEAQRAIEMARADEFRVHMMGRWVQWRSDDMGMGVPLPPEGTPLPSRVVLDPHDLERHWSKRRPWNEGYVDEAAELVAKRERELAAEGAGEDFDVYPLNTGGPAA